jgi:hypothetical protein
MSALRAFAQALRFLLELCALAALGSWGWQAGQTLPMRLGLGIGVPLAAAIVWGLFVAPKARLAVPSAVRLIIEVAFFGLATLGLAAIGRPYLAAALGIAYLLHRVLLFAADRSVRAGRQES